MTHLRLLAFLPILFLAACGSEGGGGGGAGGRRVVIGLVAKSQSNPVFQAAWTGAKEAAKRLSAERGVEIVVDWQTPPDEDAQKQAQAVERLARGGAAGIAVSCSDANVLGPAIDKAADLGVPVMCFDSDAPKSRRICVFGTDDLACGRAVMARLAEAMGDRGTIAILAGNQTAPNLQKRVQGVKDELARHPGMKLLDGGVFYHAEVPERAAEALNQAQSLNPSIEGWALVGGWPLFARDALRWETGAVKVVSVDALPAQIAYVESGHVAALLAQDCHGWGRRSVEILVARALDGRDPEGGPVLVDPLTPVTTANAREFARKWEAWLAK